MESSSWRELVIIAEGGGDGDGGVSFCLKNFIQLNN